MITYVGFYLMGRCCVTAMFRRLTILVLMSVSLLYVGCDSSSSGPSMHTNPPGVINKLDIAMIMPPDFDPADIDLDRIEITLTGPGIPLFQTEPRLEVGRMPVGVAVGLLDSDAKLDIVIANSSSETVSIYFRKVNDLQGQQPFDPRIDVRLGIDAGSAAGPVAIALGHVNSDGVLDIVTANSLSHNVTILHGSGGRSFDAPQLIPLGPAGSEIGPSALALGDEGQNGDIDFIVTTNSLTDRVSILLPNARGEFEVQNNIMVGTGPSALALGKVDNNDTLDVIVANNTANSVTVLLGDGVGNFRRLLPDIAVGEAPSALALGKVDGNDTLDIVVANRFSNNVSILLGNNNGTFTDAPNSPLTVGMEPSAVALADPRDPNIGQGLDAGPQLDIVVANLFDGDISVLLGRPDGTFNEQPRIVVGLEPAALAVGQLSDDTHLDVVAVNSGSDDILILTGQGTGGFLIQPGFDLQAQPSEVVIGKFEENGQTDMVAIAVEMSNDIKIYMRPDNDNVPRGTDFLQLLQTIDVTQSPTALALSDINVDMRRDVVATREVGGVAEIVTWLQGDTGMFASSQATRLDGDGPTALALGQLNTPACEPAGGDVNPDAIVATTRTNSIEILKGNGDGSFELLSNASISFKSASALALGDLTENDCLDIVVTSTDGNIVSVLTRERDEVDLSFSPSFTVNLDGEPVALVLGQINDDSHLDVVIVNQNNNPNRPGNVSILFGDGDGTFVSQLVMNVGRKPSALTLGDVNGDGRQDIIVANEMSNDLSILLGQGDGTIFFPQPRVVVGGEPIGVVAGRFDNDNQDGRIDQFDFIDLLTANARTRNLTILHSSQVLKNLDIDVVPERITMGERDTFAFLIELEDEIPRGANRLARVRAFLKAPRNEDFLLGCKIKDVFPERGEEPFRLDIHPSVRDTLGEIIIECQDGE